MTSPPIILSHAQSRNTFHGLCAFHDSWDPPQTFRLTHGPRTRGLLSGLTIFSEIQISQGTCPLVKMIVHDNAVNNVEIQRMFSFAWWISGLRCVHHLCNLQLQAKNNIDIGKATSNLKSKYDRGLVFAGL
ncbi:hypothetical protein B0H10DRAFT_1944497 [Mycena sp. CBHHK59/15]|nr:hypothetical protein B0H10DRAFT_1944497 [Mycena sp. CBHHK59/15]